MSTLRRADTADPYKLKQRPPGQWVRARALCVGLLLALVPSTQAQVADAQRAIEKLEGCSREERNHGCIKILKRESAGNGNQAIKAQVRGGRIIWYAFDPKTGRVRRTN